MAFKKSCFYIYLNAYRITFICKTSTYIKKHMKKENSKNEETFKMTGNWSKQVQLLQDKFAQLTDADLQYSEGHEDELIDRIAERIHKKRDEVINIIKKGQSA